MYETAKETIRQLRNLNNWNREENFNKRFDGEVEIHARGGLTEMSRRANLFALRNDTSFRSELEKQINEWLDDKDARNKVKHDALRQQLLEQTRGLDNYVADQKSELNITFVRGIKDNSVIVDECTEIETLIKEAEAFETIRNYTALRVLSMEFVVGRKVYRMGGEA